MRRRQVLKRGAAAAAGLALPGGWTRGETLFKDETPSPNPDPWVALLSDPHIDADRRKTVRGVNMADRLGGVVARLLEGPRPDLVFINGDCARDRGKPGDYAALAELLQPLDDAGLDVRLTLGNHDHRANFVEAMKRPTENYRSFGRHQQVITGPGAPGNSVWILLDSLRQTDEIPGELGRASLDWLSGQLDRLAEELAAAPVFILVHHQPEDPKDADDDGYGLADGRALLDLLWERRQVKAVFHGHKHQWAVRQVNGLHLVGLPSIAFVFKDGVDAGYAEARVKPDHLEITRRAQDPGDMSEGEKYRLVYR